MFPKINNILSFRGNNASKRNKKYNKRIISNNYLRNNTKNAELIQGTLLKSEINNTNLENINLNEKIKSNSVTNNICIIIKTSNNKKLDEEKPKNNINYDYFDSYKDIKKHNYSMSRNNFEKKGIKNNTIYKNIDFFSKNLSPKKINKSFIGKIKPYVNSNKIKKKYKHRIKANTFLILNKIKKSINNNYLNTSIEKRNNNNYEKDSLFTNCSDKYIETNESVLSLSSIRNRKNKYNELIQQKREFLGINLNNVEKRKVNRALYNEFKEYEKEKEEIEKKIKINDEIIKNEEKIMSYQMKKKYHKRVFSSDININSPPPYNKNNKNLEKIHKKSIDSTFINDNNTSKSDFSYMQIDNNNNTEKKVIKKKENNNTNNKNKSKRKKNNINLQYQKRNNNLYYKKSLNNLKTEKYSYKLSTNNNNNLINSKSYIDMLIPEEKMKQNVNSVVRDIIKIINKSKSKSKSKYKSPKKRREPIFSSPKNEIKLIQNDEDGKTFCYIKKRCKEKSRAKSKKIMNNINNINAKKKSNKNLLDYLLKNNNKKVESKKIEEKKVEINIPEGEIEALRRIKSKIENYKKISKNRIKIIRKIQKSKSFSYFIKKNINPINTGLIKRKNSLKIHNLKTKFKI